MNPRVAVRMLVAVAGWAVFAAVWSCFYHPICLVRQWPSIAGLVAFSFAVVAVNVALLRLSGRGRTRKGCRSRPPRAPARERDSLGRRLEGDFARLGDARYVVIEVADAEDGKGQLKRYRAADPPPIASEEPRCEL